jgi:hypothetical protein
MQVQGYERVRLRIVSGARTVWYVVTYDREAAHYTLDSIRGESLDVHPIALNETTLSHLRFVQKQHVAFDLTPVGDPTSQGELGDCKGKMAAGAGGR